MASKNNIQQLLTRLDQVEDHVQVELNAIIQTER